MNEGEWTAQDVREMIENGSYITIENGWQAIADAHNAALAAERETARQIKTAWDDLSIKHGELQHELAAEREKSDDLREQLMHVENEHHKVCISQLSAEREKVKQVAQHANETRKERDQLREQLAAERDKRSYSRLHVDLAEARAQLAAEREKVYDAVSHEKAVVISEVIKLRSELAAERDKVETLVDALKQLREQLAVERERCEEPRCDFVSHLQLQKQLAALVEALKEIQKINIKENDAHEVADRMGKIADAALAKVSK